MSRRLPIALAFVAALLSAGPAFAQFSQSTGASGSRSVGSLGSGRTTFSGSRGAGGSTFQGSALGGSLFGGSDPFNTSGEFLIQRREGTFVGTDSADVPRVFGGMTGSSTRSTGTRAYGSVGSLSRSYGAGARSSYGSSTGSYRSTSSTLSGSSYRSPYSSSYGSSRSPYGSSYGSSYGSTYRSPYGSSYGPSYGSTYRSPYGSSSGSTYRSPYGSSYGGGYGGYSSNYGSRYGSSYGRSGYSSPYGRRGAMGQGTQYLQTGIDLAFPPVRPTIEQVLPSLSARLERSSRIRVQSPVEVTLREGTATLKGVVASEHDRALAEQLARLEPGVFQVQNELSVAPAPSGEAPPQASSSAADSWRPSAGHARQATPAPSGSAVSASLPGQSPVGR